MSLILDALKKLEQEKAARRGRDLELGPAILKGKPRPASSRRWLLAGLAAGLLLAGAVMSLLLKVGPATSLRPEPRQAATPVTAPAVPAPLSPAPPAEAVAPPLPPPPVAPVASERPRQPLPRGVQRTAPPARPAPAAPEPPPNTAPPAELKVTGIAWQDERRGRRAVVNGLLVAEGENVGGARVVDIRPDRVRFSADGQSFDIQLSTPFPAK